MTFFGIQLHVSDIPNQKPSMNSLNRINLLQLRPTLPVSCSLLIPLQEAQPSHCKARVKDVNYVTRPVRKPAVLRVLAAQDEFSERRPVDPVRAPQHYQRTEHPPRVADILLLLRPSIQSPQSRPRVRDLPFGQPGAQAIRPGGILLESTVQFSGDGERGDADKYLAGVALGPGHGAVAGVEVGAGVDKLDSQGEVDQMQEVEQGKGIQCGVEEAGVRLAKGVAVEDARSRILERSNN